MLLVACIHPCSLHVYSLISAEVQHMCSLKYGSCYTFVNNNGNDTSYHWSTWSYQKGTRNLSWKNPGQLSISELQKITLLGTAHILRRVLSS